MFYRVSDGRVGSGGIRNAVVGICFQGNVAGMARSRPDGSIRPRPSIQDIVARTAIEQIIAGVADQRVVASGTGKMIGEGIAGDFIGPAAAIRVPDTGTVSDRHIVQRRPVAAIGPDGTESPPVEVDGGAQLLRAGINRIESPRRPRSPW